MTGAGPSEWSVPTPKFISFLVFFTAISSSPVFYFPLTLNLQPLSRSCSGSSRSVFVSRALVSLRIF